MIMKGQKINDRYQIIKTIGEGGMANVYLAYDTILDRNVAVKVLRGDLAQDEKFVRRFQREALSASSLSHPNIVEVYDVGEDNGQYYIVMEYIEGKHLKQLLKKRGNLTVTEVIDIMLQITDGMALAHDSYIIHRDIKPQNIMILENGLVKITDFGIAMAMNAAQLTQTNSVMGSVHYLPPEQASGNGSTLQSDIYSMGILMYELLCGHLPYRGDNAVEIALKHLKEPLPSIREYLPNLPQSVENVILKATAKNPKNRYADAREMHEDLKTVMDDSRINEPRYVYPYPEGEEVEKTKKVVKNEMPDDEVKVKQITKDDLKKQNKLLIALGSIFAGLIIIITTLVFIIPLITGGKEVIVPDVSNMSEKKAIKTLQDKGFKIADETKEVSSNDIEKGKVVKTNPVAGSKKVKGKVITLYLSSGSNQITIEDYTGQNFNEVKGKLSAYNINVVQEKKEVKDKKDLNDNEIIGQSVEAGKKLSPNESITLYVPDITTKYPDFSNGYTVDSVKSFCDANGVTLNVEYVETKDYTPGTIYYQSKSVGYTVSSGSSLTIKVAQGTETENNTSSTDDNLCETTGLC
jgi:serine/threonine-protein kinase prkC